MYSIQVVGRYTGLVFAFGSYRTHEEATRELEKREKHVGSAYLTRSIIEV